MLTVTLLLCALVALARADEAGTEAGSVAAAEEVATNAAAPACAEGWNEHGGRCFHYVPREMSWADAEKNCHTMKSNLASVHSVEEYQFIQNIIKGQTQASKETWIGGTDCQQDNSWLWSDGKGFSYQFWCAGEPDNLGGHQSCLQMNHGGDNCWDDVECNTALPSVCAVAL